MEQERVFTPSDMSAPAATALIPLVARAQARALFPELGFVDAEAERMVDALDLPLDSFGHDPGWLRGSVLRAKWFDNRCRRFFAANPRGLGIALGSGLNTRFLRLDLPDIDWIDIDLPEVIALKQRFVKTTNRYRMLDADVTDLSWIERIGWRPGTPVMLTAEGLLMYLAPAHVRALFRGIAAHFSAGGAAAEMLFDYASPLMVLNSALHPALRHTTARFRWALGEAGAVRDYDARYRVVEDYDIACDCGPPTALIALMHRMATLGRPFYGLAHLRLDKRAPPTAA